LPQIKLKDLAKQVSGEVAGSGEILVKGVSPLEGAKRDYLVFVLEKKFMDEAIASDASALVVPYHAKIKDKPAILVENPRLALAQTLNIFAPQAKLKKGVHKTAVVPKSCKIGKGAYLSPYVVLGENVTIGNRTQIAPHVFIDDGSQIGNDCTINAHTSIYKNSIIGNRVILHSGTRIGVDGYGFVPQDGKHFKIPQAGNVVIGNDVELYANVCISRGTIGSTIIGSGTKIDSLTHVAHNCKFGENCAIVSLVGFAGSVTLGDHVYVAGQVGFKGHNDIGENSIIMARAGITKDFPKNSVVSGFPAQDHRKEMQNQASLRRLLNKKK
jgi:UDP-3-O-[3-hydroxymyristoyl] glucosamine N-acyltransferase